MSQGDRRARVVRRASRSTPSSCAIHLTVERSPFCRRNSEQPGGASARPTRPVKSIPSGRRTPSPAAPSGQGGAFWCRRHIRAWARAARRGRRPEHRVRAVRCAGGVLRRLRKLLLGRSQWSDDDRRWKFDADTEGSIVEIEDEEGPDGIRERRGAKITVDGNATHTVVYYGGPTVGLHRTPSRLPAGATARAVFDDVPGTPPAIVTVSRPGLELVLFSPHLEAHEGLAASPSPASAPPTFTNCAARSSRRTCDDELCVICDMCGCAVTDMLSLESRSSTMRIASLASRSTMDVYICVVTGPCSTRLRAREHLAERSSA